MKRRGEKMKKELFTCFCIIFFIVLAAERNYGQFQTESEVLYVSDTGMAYDGTTTLFKVYLNTVSGYAELTPLPDVGYGPGVIPFDQVVAFACTPDGKKIYCIESQSPLYSDFYHHLGVYDLELSTFSDLGTLWGIDFATEQAAFSPDGVLYIGNSLDDELLVVDTDPTSLSYLEVSPIGPIIKPDTSTALDVGGADMVFAADGTFYLMINIDKMGAPRGLYELSLPQIPGIVWAEYKGQCPGNFTGLAIRANGYGDLVGSVTDTDSILVINREDGSQIAGYPMYLDGSPYSYEFGDMSVGSQGLCTKTIGYWKNHSWDGAGITLCGVLIQKEEDKDKDILWNCRGNNYSMLFAQLIAAKLNTNNSTGIPEIEEAENYICALWSSDWQSHVHDPIPKSEKKTVTALWNALDRFNNSFQCK
jgi:hypothetical protein